ncbi:hypothetical protein N7337_07910 [Comamonas aquatica]|uniref:hypothetical protein n=1 Tax=Comamonas aquatica TaxID=225991 RepID=UPI00244AFC47|nr:hypothetical protein [Comamonas aquatica]MDH0200832.1 hypothetical protein [Comamonas aquatica]
MFTPQTSSHTHSATSLPVPVSGAMHFAAPAHPDDAAVDALAALMKAKLAEKRAKGYGGWNDKTQCPQQRLSDMLRAHVDKGDPVDVANFCAMLSARGEGIAAAQQAVQAAVPEAIEQMAEDRYKVVPSHESMFHRWAVVAGNGTQQLYAGREVECQNVARKFTGAFLDGAFAAMQNTSPAHPAVGVPDARAARQITDAIVENFKDAGWSMPSIDEARVLEAVSAAIGEHGATEPLTGVASDVDSMARVLMAAFAKAEPEHPITRYPTSFVATFADMARAAIAAAQLAEGVPAQSYVVDFFKAKGFYPSPAQAFAAGVALAATQPAAQGMDALTPAARDVLAERKRQIETEGWKPERDDVYDTGEMALAAACYAAHSASCAAIKAPHTARGVFVRTRSAQDFVGEMWPWSADWWKPSGHRRNLEKAAALILAEIERIDRAALAAQAKQGGA